MKKKNAFTLIELLAIIVILAIIAVITVPIILNIIENTRKGAAIDSAYGFKDSVNKYYVTKLSEDRQFQLEGPYNVSDGYINGANITGSVEIPTSGNKPSSGTLTYSNNTLTGGCLVFGGYEVIFTGNSVTNTQKGDCSTYVFNPDESEQDNSGSVQTGEPLEIGTTVNYSTSLNDVTLNNWKVFLSDENYTYLIYGGYLPVEAIDIDEITEYNAYCVYPNVNEDNFISVMLDKSKWESLLEGTLNEVISVKQKNNNNTIAMASPTIELWRDSWNAKYPTAKITILYRNVEESYINGWYVNTEDTDEDDLWNYSYANLSEATGYSDSLYFPFKNTPEGSSGYYLSSKAPNINTPTPLYVYEGGYVGEGSYDDGDYSFRPVIKLPTSIVNPQ